MKILHTSDWHLGKSLYDFSLLDDARRMLDFILDVISLEKIDAVVIAGDIYDRPVPPAEAVRLYDYFLTKAAGTLHVPVIAVAGNHDSASRLEFGSKLYAGSGYHIFGSVKADAEPVILRDEFGEVHFHAVPWLHHAEVRGLFGDAQNQAPRSKLQGMTRLDTEAQGAGYENPRVGIKSFDDAYRVLLSEITGRLDKNARNVAVAHGFFAGISAHKEKEILVSDSEMNIGGMDIADSSCFSAFDYTALGHLHAPQRAGADNVRYSGSPLKYSLSEEKQRKSCTIVELKRKGEVKTSFIDIPAIRDVRSVTGSFDDLMEPSFHQNKAFGDYVFANITGPGVIYPMEKLRTLFPNLLGLRFISESGDNPTPLTQSQIAPRMTMLELFCRFYKDTKSTEIPGDRLEFLRGVIAKYDIEKP